MLRIDRIGLFEQLTLAMLFLWSMVPTRFYGEFTLFGVVANFGDFSIVIAFMLLSVLLPFHAADRYANLVFLLFSMIAIWAFVTIPHDQTGEIGWRYVVYSLVISYLAMAVGYAMALSAAETEPFLTRLAGLFTFIFVVYAAESLLGLGLRSAEGTSITEMLGIQRLKGPLGGSAIIGTLMIPVIAIHLSNLINKRPFPSYHWAAMLATIACVILSGSRASLIGLLLFVVLIVIRFGSVRMIVAVLASGIVVVGILQQVMSFERYASFADRGREETIATSFRMLTDNPRSLFLGQGHGAVWPWYQTDIKLVTGEVKNWQILIQQTEYGILLYHPHSLYLGMLVELGLAALCLFGLLLLLPIWVSWRKNDGRMRMPQILAMGMLSTYPLLLLDYYLFKNWIVSIVWWIFLFSTMLLRRNEG